MKIEPECIPCNINFGIKISRRLDDVNLREIINLVSEFIGKDVTPADIGTRVWKFLTNGLKNSDLFKKEKRLSNRIVKSLISKLNVKSLSFNSAVKLAVIGNAFDIVPPHSPKKINIRKLVKQKLVIDERKSLKRVLNGATSVLYLSDNAGEIGFDYILIEKLRKMGIKIFLTVKKYPLVNDATISDAKYFGLEKSTTLLPLPAKFGVRKSDIPADVLNLVDVIIAKGQANYETVSEEEWHVPVAYLLKAKCVVVARNFKVPIGSNICKVVL